MDYSFAGLSEDWLLSGVFKCLQMSSIYRLLLGEVRRTSIVSATHIAIFLAPKFHKYKGSTAHLVCKTGALLLNSSS